MDERRLDYKKEIEIIKKEEDIPPNLSYDKNNISDLSPKEKRDWQKWLKNLDFLKYIIGVMIFIYLIDTVIAIFVPNASRDFKEPFFEVLKTMLFTASGYVFAKTGNES